MLRRAPWPLLGQGMASAPEALPVCRRDARPEGTANQAGVQRAGGACFAHGEGGIVRASRDGVLVAGDVGRLQALGVGKRDVVS